MVPSTFHTWRLFASDDPDDSFRISKELRRLTSNIAPIDTWIVDGQLLFGGLGDPPRGDHIKVQPCSCDRGCQDCCFTGNLLHWVEVPQELVEEAIREIKKIMADLRRVIV